MDELEISGKRFISTRRAAKEYKYHSDYIGQLIRGKKLVGRKVGRSWYVELDSLAAYFEKEGVVGASQVEEVIKAVAEPVEEIKVEPRVAEAPVVTVVAEVVEPSKIEKEVEKNIEIENVSRDSIHIPVRVERPSFEPRVEKVYPMLTYISDDEPYIPMTHRHSYGELHQMTVMPRSHNEADEMNTEEKIDVKQPKPKGFKKIVGVAALGFAVMMLVVGSSFFVKSHTVVEAGKAASVGYSLQ